jgi:hypothetical protein
MNTNIGRILWHVVTASVTSSALVVFAAGCGGTAAPSTVASSGTSAATSAAASNTPSTGASTAASATPSSGAFPSTLLGLPEITGATAHQISSAIVGPMATTGVLVRPQVAIYGGQNNGMIVVRSALSAAAKKYGGNPTASSMRTGLLVMGVTDVQTFPPGASRASLACGKLTRGGQSVIFCEHYATTGIVITMFFNGLASSVSDAASKTSQVLSAIGA